MSDTPDVAIVIVNWNSLDYTRACIRSIYRWTTRPVEIVVVDSGSFDGTGDMLRLEHPSVTFVQIATNVGFAKANNTGARECRAPLLLFLNPDTELLSPVVDILADNLLTLPSAGLVGARLLNTDGSLQATSVLQFPRVINQLLDTSLLRALLPGLALWGPALVVSSPSVPLQVEAVSGACMMTRRDTFECVGGFNEQYFMYAEDIELAHAIRCAGHVVYHVPDATLTHHGGSSSSKATSGFQAVMLREANYRFLAATRGAKYALIYKASMLPASLVRCAAFASARFFLSGDARRACTMKLAAWWQVAKWAVGGRKITGRYYS